MCRVVNLARLHLGARRAPSGGPCRARSAGRTAPARSAAATGPAPRPTTCDVAAVPRNWQPPPGEAHARQPSSAASSKLISPCAKRAPMDCTLPASSPSVGGSVTPPGTSTHGRSCIAARAIIIAGRPLSQVATPITPLPRRQRADQPAQHHRGVVAIGQAVHHAGRALRAAVAGIGAEAGERDAAERTAVPRPPPSSAGRPPSGRCDSPARPACRRGRGCRRTC